MAFPMRPTPAFSRSRTRPPAHSSRLDSAPLAVTSKGQVLVNVAYIDNVRSVGAMAKHLRALRGPLFVGLLVEKREAAAIVNYLDDACAEATCLVGRTKGKRRG